MTNGDWLLGVSILTLYEPCKRSQVQSQYSRPLLYFPSLRDLPDHSVMTELSREINEEKKGKKNKYVGFRWM